MTRYRGPYLTAIGMMVLQGCAMTMPAQFGAGTDMSEPARLAVLTVQASQEESIGQYQQHDRRTAATVPGIDRRKK